MPRLLDYNIDFSANDTLFFVYFLLGQQMMKMSALKQGAVEVKIGIDVTWLTRNLRTRELFFF